MVLNSVSSVNYCRDNSVFGMSSDSHYIPLHLSIAVDQGTFSQNQKKIIIFLFLRGNLCCGYSLELPHWAILMSTHNIGFEEK